MTTIAWDGTHLAADRQATNGGLPREVRKINSDGGIRWVWACCGEAQDAEAFTQWMRDGMNRTLKPALADDFAALLLEGDPTAGALCYRLEHKLFPVRVLEPFTAIGSGRDFAIAAMALGQTAAEAVRLASQFDVYTGAEVDVWPT